jgi:Holliday junction resolvase RusA-like endonuclease
LRNVDRFVFILPGSIRSKKNSKIAVMVGGVNKPKRAILLPSKAYAKWEKMCHVQLLKDTSGISRPVFAEGPLHVKAICYYKGKRPDLSGALESVGDCCEGWLWADDTQIESWDGSRLKHDKAAPLTVVEVSRLSEAQICK